MKQSILDLINISTYAGDRVDYTQGGGGNTSVKCDNGLMLIKASGFRLIDITENTGFVAVDCKKIKDYYNQVDLSVKKDYEKESAEVSKSSVVELEGLPVLRPSVEVGFHAILKKYVVHTHSVYANLITCAVKGESLAQEIFAGADYGYIFLPYINPGFTLTLKMKEAINNYVAQTGKYPEVIFMKNHGLVINADTVERVKKIHTDVNDRIMKYFALPDNFRKVELVEDNGAWISKTENVKKYTSELNFTKELLDKYPLYPDQLVYLNNLIANTPEKMVVGSEVKYNCELKEARTLEETFVAYLFVVANLKKAGLEISVMNEEEVGFINGWEAEKYRRSVAK